MPLPHSRLTDVGVGSCSCGHGKQTGNLITGSPNVNVNGLPSARLTDVVLAGCGHTGIMVGGSGTVYSNGLNEVRITDPFSGCFSGTIVTGSPNVNTGN